MQEFKKIDGEQFAQSLLGPLLKNLIEIRDGLQTMVSGQEAKLEVLKGGPKSQDRDSVDYIPHFPDDNTF